MMTIAGDKLQRYQEYVDALRNERRKILMFPRDCELPLCLDLVTQAIEVCKQQLPETKSECNSEQTASDDGPVFREFMPPPSKRNPCSDELKHESQESKRDWLKSAGISLDPPNKEKVPVLGVNGGGGAFHPFKKEASDTPGTEVSEIRKARRCWSPELHRLFLQTLKQLGGSHVATPKQIRETMKIHGLTNDEVKSHLQKYRLHIRRTLCSSSVRYNTSYNPQTPQLVVDGGIWDPSPEYATGAAVSDEPSAVGQNGEYGFPARI